MKFPTEMPEEPKNLKFFDPASAPSIAAPFDPDADSDPDSRG